MNRDFEFGFDHFDKPQQRTPSNSPLPDEYSTPSHTRNVCFVWLDGRMKFLNYAYLVSTDYLPDEGIISLTFTSEAIVLKGIRLQSLFEKLLFHLPLRIMCQDERYNQLKPDSYCVNEIFEK